MNELRNEVKACVKCRLYKTRKNVVFGSGNEKADLMFIGEAPGASEDIKGLPFVGQSGQLLDKFLEAIGIKREDVYIANICKCRPPGNRDPHPDEIKVCEPYLHKQIAHIKPKVIVALGRVAGQTLLNTSTRITDLRGTIGLYQNIPTVVTWHPAFVLRNMQSITPDQMLKDLLLAKEKLKSV